MSNLQLKVVYLAGGYPTPENPSHGIFNERAAKALKDKVSLTVIQYRIYKPGRKFKEEIKENGFTRIILCVPFIPVFQNKLQYFNNRLFYYFTLLFTKHVLASADIVHASDGNLGVFARWLKQQYKFKLLTQFIGGDLNQDLPQIHNKSWMKSWTKKLDAVSFNSVNLLQCYNGLFNESATGRVIYRGVDTDIFVPAADNKEEIIFYFLGGLPNYSTFEHGRNTKGGLNIMKAWSMLENDKAASNIKLLFAGPDSDIDVVKKWHAGLKQPQRVHIVGKINPADIPAFHRSGNIALIPSLEEGLPNAAMEAASTGNLIIANAVGGIPEIITDSMTGILCKTNDEAGLYEKMKWAISNRQQIKTIGNAARENMKSNFSSRDFGKKYVEYYFEILKRN